jgi:putative tryptophan/tyrosine transport system ATP-binding protein
MENDESVPRELIKIDNVSKTFFPGSANEIRAMANISLTIHEGDFLTVIGTNGSGKSTLLNLLAGSFRPDSGKIYFKGKDITNTRDYQRAKAVVRVFQNPFLGTAKDMTIAENLLLAYKRGKPKYPIISLRQGLLGFFKQELTKLEMQVEDRLDQVIGTLSGGQRQAISLLMAVLQKPEILLLDEHTAALDPKTAIQVMKLTKFFLEEYKLTTIMITHSMQQALDFGNRTIMLHKGKIIDDLTREEKGNLTYKDLLEKFNQIRKKELLTPELQKKISLEYA